MLEALRRGAQTRVAKLLFGLLVASFSIWGVHDVFRGWGRGSLASVGSTAITVDEFRRAYQNELDRISEDAKRKITAQQGHAFGLDRQVLGQLINGAAIENHARQMGLAVSNAPIIKEIESAPAFQGKDGKFSKAQFDGFLDRLGLSEQSFLSIRRKDELRGAIFDTLTKAQTVPKPLFDAMHAYNGEKRVIEWVKIDPEAVSVPVPDEAKIKSLYEADKSKYMTPEYRKVELLQLNDEDFKKQYKFTDDDVAKAFKDSPEAFNKPELRRVQQLTFKDKAAADAALKSLNDGSKSFGDVAKDIGLKDAEVDLGLVPKKALIDPKIADAAFSLAKDKVSDVIQGRFVTAIIRVPQIEPAETHTLDEVKDKVRDKLANDKLAADKAKGEIQNRHDEIEDARIAGKSLADIAKQFGLNYQLIAAVDAQGLTPDGKPALQSADLRTIVARAFAPQSSGDDTAIQLADGGYAWTNVLSTDAPKQKPFDQVKDEVKDNFMSSEGKRLRQELAKKLAERVNGGATMASIEGEAKNKVEKTEPITRKTIPQSLSDTLVAQAFKLQLGKAGHAPSSDKTTEIVFRIADVIPAPAATQSETENLSRQLEGELATQTFTEYTEALKKRYGATVNEAELKTISGASDE